MGSQCKWDKAAATPLRNEKLRFQWLAQPHTVFGHCPGLAWLRSTPPEWIKSRSKASPFWERIFSGVAQISNYFHLLGRSASSLQAVLRFEARDYRRPVVGEKDLAFGALLGDVGPRPYECGR